MHKIKWNLIILLLSSVFAVNAWSKLPNTAFDRWAAVPIQQNGRIQPLDTFAREVVEIVTGKTSYQNQSAVNILFSWLAHHEAWMKVPMFQMNSLELKKALSLPMDQKYFSYETLSGLQNLPSLMSGVSQKQMKEEKLTPFEEALDRVALQISLFERLSQGELWSVIPHKDNHLSMWLTFSELKTLPQDAWTEEVAITLQGVLNSVRDSDQSVFYLTSDKLKNLLSEYSKDPGYPYVKTLRWEVFYNSFHPFRKAWILYMTFALGCFWYWIMPWKWLFGVNCAVFGLAAFSHILGFVIRCFIAGRPPVGTMYESIVWVCLGVVFFGSVLSWVYKNWVTTCLASIVATVGLILADQSPIILNSSLKPLTPVLRSNYWLTIHVLTITLSYAAFALALGVGNWMLIQWLRKTKDSSKMNLLQNTLMKSLYVGILLLASGTILGGVWADYSWGRFWGWDPKEVWALIALLFYLIVIHGRYAGWLGEFGIVAAAVIAFQGVLMAWYGVNFVLGVGLHSYGFGSGGTIYVISYSLIQILFVGLSWLQYRSYKA